MAKRLFDVVFSALGLVILSPLLLAVAVWVRLDSPGPSLFRQERVGRFGTLFRIHKFRSMASPPADPSLSVAARAITIGADPRITRAGAFLRRTKIDELPQLLDVLLGDMSFVGPRPEVPQYVASYPADVKAKVLSVRPGITDLASLQYRHESDVLARAADPEREYREVVLPAKLKLAVEYVEQASFLGDIRVIGLTLKTLFFAR